MSVLVDTNVLVYAEDAQEPIKSKLARDCLDAIAVSGTGTITPQVLAEFFVTVTRKLHTPLEPVTAASQLDWLSTAFRVVPLCADVSLTAAAGSIRYGMHYYDAQIWASARLNGIGWVLSEDFADGLDIEGVRFANPFAPDFDVERVLAD